MAVSRASAKASLTDPEDSDPELADALNEGGRLRVSLEKENNRHKEKIAQIDVGWAGRLLGGPKNAPLAIGFMAIAVGIVAWLWCLNQAQLPESNADFWGTQADRALALAGTALGFVFGRSSS